MAIAPPPIHITGAPFLDWIILAIGAVVALYWLRALRLAREGVSRFLTSVVNAGVVFIVCEVVLSSLFKVDHSRSQGLAFCIAFVAFVRWQSFKRSRYIPRATKRAVIARDLPDGGYDPKVHHIDHVWPHSRGGSTTGDNLRVIAKERNLRKGAKRPGLRDMF
jgi:5-methylcytosine-specific restriction endonuclease McrA